MTGEEDDDTIATAEVALFEQKPEEPSKEDKESESSQDSWAERGSGTLKLNRDKTTKRLRFVMHNEATIRLILNAFVNNKLVLLFRHHFISLFFIHSTPVILKGSNILFAVANGATHTEEDSLKPTVCFFSCFPFSYPFSLDIFRPL